MLTLRAMLLVTCVFGSLAAARADQTDPRLEALFARLEEAPTSGEAAPIEREIWTIWFETADEEAASLMRAGVAAMERGDYRAALGDFDQVVEVAPDFAEGWNRRATVHYLVDNLELSLADIDKTLELEPRHFGALAGQGLVYVERKELERALQSFEAALAVNPQMPGPRINAEAIRQILKEQEI